GGGTGRGGKGGGGGGGGAPASVACLKVMGSSPNRLASTAAARGPGIRSFPSAILIATSQADAALTNAPSESAMALRASGCSEGSSALHHRKTWVSRRSCSALSHEVLQDIGRQRGVEVLCDPQPSLPATGLPRFPDSRERAQPCFRRPRFRNHDLLPGRSPVDELRQPSLGLVQIHGLRSVPLGHRPLYPRAPSQVGQVGQPGAFAHACSAGTISRARLV